MTINLLRNVLACQKMLHCVKIALIKIDLRRIEYINSIAHRFRCYAFVKEL